MTLAIDTHHDIKVLTATGPGIRCSLPMYFATVQWVVWAHEFESPYCADVPLMLPRRNVVLLNLRDMEAP